jgi:hypothetical protein
MSRFPAITAAAAISIRAGVPYRRRGRLPGRKGNPRYYGALLEWSGGFSNRGPNHAERCHLASCQHSAARRARFQGPILNSSIACFVAVAVYGASTKLMNLAHCRHEPVLFGHLTPAASGLQEGGDRAGARQDRRCPFTVFRTIETFLNTR